MANLPFEYRIINPLERPKAEDLNIAQGQAHGDTRLLARELFDTQNGFLGDGFLLGVTPGDATKYVRTFSGVFFQSKSAEYAIGGVPGLNDELAYKVGYIGSLDVGCQPVPTGTNEKRYDLLQVRALTGTERLTNEETVDILNPALQSFISATNLAKTLTASFSSGILEGQYPVYTASSDPVTGAMSYVSGEVTVTADWNLVPKPTPAAGYLPVGYIKRYAGQTTIAAGDIEDARPLLSLSNSVLGTVPVTKGGTGQTSLSSGEILLGNGTNSITSTAVLPVSKGGTGNSSTSAATGSVAWFNNTLDKIEYTQAVTGLYDTPVSGYLLASNSSGAPNWIAPGAAGQVLVSTGTAWEASDLPGGGTSYLTSGTHDIAAFANFVEIICIGAGGGGGGGARSDTGGEQGSGGGGGGGGGLTRVLYSAANLRTLGTTLDITVGTGGAGGAGASTPDAEGSNGIGGGFSSVFIGVNALATANGGGGGQGGKPNTSVSAFGGLGGNGAVEAGSAGGAGVYTAPESSDQTVIGAATGGGAGGGYSGSTAKPGASSDVSGSLTRYLAPASGGNQGNSGAAGTPTSFGIAGTGGGGGGGEDGASGGAGGAGGAGGGGGGGGGYCRLNSAALGFAGGNGGNGGNGRVIIREW